MLLEFEGVYRSRHGLRERRARRALGDRVHRLHRRPRRPPAASAPTTRSGSSAAPTRTPAGTPAPASTGRCTSSSPRSRTSPWTASASPPSTSTTSSPSSRSRRRSSTTAGAWRTLDLVTEIRDGDGAVVATATSPVTVLPGEPAVVRQRVLLPEPALWSPDSPVALLRRRSSLRDGDDRRGRRHGDLRHPDAVAGPRARAADQRRAGEAARRVRPLTTTACSARRRSAAPRSAGSQLLKAAGFNALRSAHNPMSRAMLDACDRLGVLVMDELTDMWTESKTDFDARAGLPGVVGARRRGDGAQGRQPPERHPLLDRQRDPRGRRSRTGRVWSRRLAEKVRSLDDTRFVTNGINAMLARDRRGPTAARREAPASTRCSPTWARSWTSSPRPSWSPTRTAESYDVLDVAGHELHGGPLRDRPRAVPEPGHRRLGDLRRTRSTGCGGSSATTRTSSATSPGPAGTTWARPASAGCTLADDPTRRPVRRRPTRGCSRTCGDIDITGHRRPASYYREIVFGLRSDPYLAVQRPRAPRPRAVGRRPWAWTDTVGSWSGPAPRAARSPSRSTATPTRSSCCWTASRWASRRRGRRTASGPSSR